MKLTCERNILLDALHAVTRIVPSKSTLPILANLLLQTEQDRLMVQATTLETVITVRVPAEIADAGALTLPARLLSDWVGSVTDGPLTIAQDGKRHAARVTCGRAATNIRGMDADDWPKVPAVPDTAPYALPAGLLRTLIDSTVFAVARDGTRPVLGAVLVKLDGDTIELAGADGYRLAFRTATVPPRPDVEGGQPPPTKLLVPGPAIREVGRLLTEPETLVELAPTTKGQVLFRTGSAEVFCRLIEGEFPDYRKILPREYTTRAVVNREEWQRATRAASVFARDSSMMVTMAVTVSDDPLVPGQMQVTAASQDLGDHAEPVDAAVEGESGTITLNGVYLRDALDAIETPQVALEFSGPTLPGVLRPVGSDADASFTQVIMPMQAVKTAGSVAPAAGAA